MCIVDFWGGVVFFCSDAPRIRVLPGTEKLVFEKSCHCETSVRTGLAMTENFGESH